jgi:hypothetical protein
MRERYPNEEGTVSEPEAATTPPAAEPATAVTPATEPKPEATEAPKPAPDWEKAYKGLQTNYNRLFESNADLKRQVQTQVGTSQSMRGDLDVLLKTQLGDDGYKKHLETRQADSERQQALAAAQAANEYIPQSINVIAETMRASGVSEKEIEQVFLAAANSPSVRDWAETVKAGTSAAIAQSRAKSEQSVEAKVRASSQENIQAEAEVLAEKTLRAKGIDKVDLGRGQSRTPERSFIERVRSIDRNTPEGEAAFQKMFKESQRGTLRT